MSVILLLQDSIKIENNSIYEKRGLNFNHHLYQRKLHLKNFSLKNKCFQRIKSSI